MPQDNSVSICEHAPLSPIIARRSEPELKTHLGVRAHTNILWPHKVSIDEGVDKHIPQFLRGAGIGCRVHIRRNAAQSVSLHIDSLIRFSTANCPHQGICHTNTCMNEMII